MDISRWLKKVVSEKFWLFLSGGLAMIVYAALAHEVVIEQEDWFDTRVFSFFERYSTPAIIHFFNGLTFLGSSAFLVPSYATLVIFLFLKRRREEAVDILIVGTISAAMIYSLKTYYTRQRPGYPLIETLTSYSFPSGHALGSFVFCSILIYLVWQSTVTCVWKWLATLLLLSISIAIGISRVVLRYHYASDVLAGLCLGLSWVLFAWWLRKLLRSNS